MLCDEFESCLEQNIHEKCPKYDEGRQISLLSKLKPKKMNASWKTVSE